MLKGGKLPHATQYLLPLPAGGDGWSPRLQVIQGWLSGGSNMPRFPQPGPRLRCVRLFSNADLRTKFTSATEIFSKLSSH